MKRKKQREIVIFGVSFMDVLANTIGGLAFLLILAMLMVNAIIFAPPLITTEKLPDGYANREYMVWLGAREGLGLYNWSFGEGEHPPGLKLDSLTGKLSGVLRLPAMEQGTKSYEFSVVCQSDVENESDEPKTDERQYRLTVYDRAPFKSVPLRIMTRQELPAAYVDQPYPLVFAAEGGQPPYRWRMGSGSFPPGLALSSDGQLSGRARVEGEYTFNVTVSTKDGEQKAENFTLKVSRLHPPPPPPPPLEILTDSLPDAVAQRVYTIWPAAQGGKPPYRWSMVSGGPGWIGVGGEANLFTGRPELADVGKNQLTLQVSDASGQMIESAPMNLKVLPPTGKKPPPLEILTRSLPDARVGQPYEVAIAVKGGYPPYQWQSNGASQTGSVAFIPDNGIIGGVPKQAGRVNYAVMVTDLAGTQSSANFSLHIHPAVEEVSILTTEIALARVGQPFVFELSAVGGYPPYHWQLTEGQLPPGLALNENNGRIRGIPLEAGSWPLGILARDAEGRASTNVLSTEVQVLTRRGARKLIITTEKLPTLLVGEDASITLACEGGTEPYSWEITSDLPEGLQRKESRIRGEPSEAGIKEFEFRVKDAAGEVASVILPLRIKNMVPFWLAVLLGVLLLLAVLAILFLLRAYSRRRPPEILPLEIITRSIPNARASCDYSVQLACIGGEPPYYWRIVKGELPPGLKLSDDGVISGKPFEGISVEHTKEVLFTVEVRDHRGTKATRSL